ncbi:MAG: bifunctional 2-polyprenyl-6-hydroxyphenol methylase/3-demethylubiquinol 3-O-methyltransferase UbiG [Burkholderiaceae bacterium]
MKKSLPNVDLGEIEKFSSLANKWWDPESEFKPLHDINPIRLTWINNIVGGLKNKNVCDVGCGGGILAESMSSKGATVKGIDLSQKSINVAKIHANAVKSSVNYQLISSQDLSKTENEKYDVVTCMEMLEHVPDPKKEILACTRLLKPSGQIIFSTINRNLKSFLFAIVGAEYILNLLPKGTHEYKKFVKPSELIRTTREANLNVIELIGLTYNPITKVYKLSKDTDVNYMVAFTK